MIHVNSYQASSGVVEVLVRTGAFSTRALLGRLLGTVQWLTQVTHDVAAIQPGGEGHIASIRVRLVHASVRQRILNLTHKQADYFDAERFGIPVSDLDSVHSISTFACNHMWLQLPKFGITPRADEIEDYIAFFRYIAYLLGTPTSYFNSAERAKKVMESLYVNELSTTETSQVVAHNLISCVENLPSPFNISREFSEAGARWVNGDDLCNELKLGHPRIVAYLAFAGHCILVNALIWTQRIIPYADELMINVSITSSVRRSPLCDRISGPLSASVTDP